MHNRAFRANLLLLLAAVIWGFAFVAQRIGMEHVGPYTFNGVRFLLGGLSLVPLLVVTGNRRGEGPRPLSDIKPVALAGLIAGTVLFTAASLQQVGLAYTTAGKAGFITGLYVVLVPLMGLLWRQYPNAGTWTGAVLAAVGLWFLSVTETFTIAFGDFLELVGAFFWAGHVLIVGWLSPRFNAVQLALSQFLVCAALSLGVGLAMEPLSLEALWRAAPAIFYGGVGSVGIAYTLQVVAQKEANPAHAAIILSMESPFAALGGWLVLNEILTGRNLFGCTLMLGGMVLAQIHPYLFGERRQRVGVSA